MFLSDLVRDLTMEVPNLTDTQAMRALQRAARRFYSETLLWEDRRSYQVGEGASSFRLSLPIDECSVITVKYVYFDGEELPLMRQTDFQAASSLPSASYPHGVMPSLSKESVFIAPSASVKQAGYEVVLVLAPSMDADELPLDAYSQFEDAYIVGALSGLYSKGLFLNPALADVNEARFSDFVTRAVNLRDGLYSGPAKVVGYGGL